jgi:hypothetical protein
LSDRNPLGEQIQLVGMVVEFYHQDGRQRSEAELNDNNNLQRGKKVLSFTTEKSFIFY